MTAEVLMFFQYLRWIINLFYVLIFPFFAGYLITECVNSVCILLFQNDFPSDQFQTIDECMNTKAKAAIYIGSFYGNKLSV